ncbi:methyltransferase domain-containing protein [Bradyrhizobium sp. URHC0002]
MKKLRKLISKFTPERILRKSSLLIMENFQGVDFSRIVWPEEVGLDSKYVGESTPTWNKYLVRLLKDLHINDQDTILDIGCGKGSAMLAMLKFPFARVDGIELSQPISETAIRNLTKLKKQRWQIFNGDAITCKNYNTYSMLYFYHPFPKEIMRQVVANIHSSISGRQQEMLVIYNNPVCHEEIVENGVFCKLREYPNGYGDRIFVYSNKDLQHSRLHRPLS